LGWLLLAITIDIIDMKSSHLLTLILALAPIGLTFPAHADQAVVSDSVQTAIVNGNNNTVTQNNNTSVRGDYRSGNNGTSVRNRQTADVAGDNNTVNQENRTDVRQQRGR
jgi:hypothetical protein